MTISKKGAKYRGLSDKKRPRTVKDYAQLVQQLWQIVKAPRRYKYSPLKRTLIPKAKGGLRPIYVPTYIDRAVQHLYRFFLDVVSDFCRFALLPP
jgi:retron-type reverse transcriptase